MNKKLSFGKLGVLVENPKIEIKYFTDDAKRRGACLDTVLRWNQLPKATLSQSDGQKFLFITNDGNFVLDTRGVVVEAYFRSDFNPEMVVIVAILSSMMY